MSAGTCSRSSSRSSGGRAARGAAWGWAGGRLSAAMRRRFGHLQAFRPVHAASDPLVDLVEELVDEDVRGDFFEHTAVGVDEADVAAAGDTEIGVPRLPRPIDRT